MDDFEDMDDHFDDQDYQCHARDFFEELSPSEFIEHFRFDKTSVRRLVDLLERNVMLDTFHGLNAEQQVCFLQASA